MHDAFICKRYSLLLESQLRALKPKLDWIIGGHVTSAIVQPILQTKLIVETVHVKKLNC